MPADLVNHVAVGYVPSAVGRPEPFEWMANGKTESMTLRKRRHMPRRTEVFATWLGGILTEWIQDDTHVDASEGMHRGVHPAAGMAR